MIVLDASAAAALLLNQPRSRAIGELLAEQEVAAPELLGVELLSVLRGWVRGRGLTPARAQEAFVDLEDLGIIWYSERALLREAWGMRDRASAYDAIYLALARALSLPGQGVRVLTLDERLARACPDLTLVPSGRHADRPPRAHGAPGLGGDSSMS